MPTTFMHVSDEHLDEVTHSSLNAATGRHLLWESNFRVLRFLADTAVERGVDAFVSAGDNFRDGRPSAEAYTLFADALRPVAEAGIPIVLLDGNHHLTGVPTDHATVIHVVAGLLRGMGGTVHVASGPELIRLDTGLQVAALPWLSKNRVLDQLGETDLTPTAGDQLVTRFGIDQLTALASAADPTVPLIMASHVTVDRLRIDAVADGFNRGSELDLSSFFSEPVLPIRELEHLPFRYGALGHIHTPQKMGDRYYYAGSPNRLTFTDMRDAKGGNLVTLAADGTFTVERVLTSARLMAELDLERPDTADRVAALEPGTLVQVRLVTGEPELPRELRQAITKAGATLANVIARAVERPAPDRPTLPEKVDPVTALRAWAEAHPTAHVTTDALIGAAEKLEG